MSRRFAASSRDAWLVAGRTMAPERRSIIFEVVTRLVFHSIIVFSIYLLLAGHNFSRRRVRRRPHRRAGAHHPLPGRRPL